MASTGPTATASERSTVQSICTWVLMLALPITAGCEAAASKTTACDGLVYKDSGLTRAEYLPCAGEMITTLDLLAPQIENMLTGDENARTAAQSTVRELRGLMKKAGWRDMLERWDDRALTSLNSDIWNAFNHHESLHDGRRAVVQPRASRRRENARARAVRVQSVSIVLSGCEPCVSPLALDGRPF